MKSVWLTLSIALCFVLIGSSRASPPEIAFESVDNFFKLPADVYFGEVAGIAVNSKKHVFVMSRGNSTGPAYGAAASQLLEFDAHGKFVREIGHNLYAWSFAHAVRVDRHDNIWAVDKGSDVVVRFDPKGRVSLVLGRKTEASDEAAHPHARVSPPLPPINGMFRQVTDVTWDSNDDIFVSDGYINSRVAKYDKEGNWITSWGEPGSGPGQFSVLHAIVTDHQDRIYVADRGNARIQVFDQSGKLLKIIAIDLPAPADAREAIGFRPAELDHGPGAPKVGAAEMEAINKTMRPGSPWAMCITEGPVQYLFVADAFPGRIYKLSLDGEVLGWLGSSGRTLKKFGWIHSLACPNEREIYVGEILNWRAQKLVLNTN